MQRSFPKTSPVQQLSAVEEVSHQVLFVTDGPKGCFSAPFLVHNYGVFALRCAKMAVVENFSNFALPCDNGVFRHGYYRTVSIFIIEAEQWATLRDF